MTFRRTLRQGRWSLVGRLMSAVLNDVKSHAIPVAHQSFRPDYLFSTERKLQSRNRDQVESPTEPFSEQRNNSWLRHVLFRRFKDNNPVITERIPFSRGHYNAENELRGSWVNEWHLWWSCSSSHTRIEKPLIRTVNMIRQGLSVVLLLYIDHSTR